MSPSRLFFLICGQGLDEKALGSDAVFGSFEALRGRNLSSRSMIAIARYQNLKLSMKYFVISY